MNRYMRIRRFNKRKNIFDVLFPQTVTSNILRRDNGGILETFLSNYDKHLLNSTHHLNHTYSIGTERKLEAHIKHKVLEDGFPLLLTVHCNVECEPTLDFNGSGPKKILSGAGEPIPGGQCSGSTMFLVYNEGMDAWILMSSDTYSDITKVFLPVVHEYVYTADRDDISVVVIPGFDANTNTIDINYGQTILRYGIDYEFVPNSVGAIRLLNFTLNRDDVLFFKITTYTATSKRGNFKYDIDVQNYRIDISETGTTLIDIPVPAIGVSHLEINYGQTILRESLDYNIIEDGTKIEFSFGLYEGDIILLRTVRFIETNGEIVPNNWGATGNYRYSLNVLHEEYTATEDNITVIPVPNFNRRKDEISVIRENKLLVYDVDYTIDTLDQVVLLTSHLDTNDSIYFTILQGAMMDVPNFNVITASGQSGQHIHLDMSYSLLCNHYTLLVKLIHDLETAPTAKCIDGPAEPICDCFGNPVYGGYKSGSYLWLVYNEDLHVWYSLGHGQMDVTSTYPTYKVTEGDGNFFGNTPVDIYYGDDPDIIGETVIQHNLGSTPSQIIVSPTEPPNIDENGYRTSIGDIWYHADEVNLYVGNTGNATSAFHWVVSTQAQTTDLKAYLERELAYIKSRPGKFVTRVRAYTAPENGISIIPIEDFRPNVDKLLMVNYGQTVLREITDYIIDGSNINLLNFRLSEGDILQFIVVVQEPDE